ELTRRAPTRAQTPPLLPASYLTLVGPFTAGNYSVSEEHHMSAYRRGSNTRSPGFREGCRFSDSIVAQSTATSAGQRRRLAFVHFGDRATTGWPKGTHPTSLWHIALPRRAHYAGGK